MVVYIHRHLNLPWRHFVKANIGKELNCQKSGIGKINILFSMIIEPLNLFSKKCI